MKELRVLLITASIRKGRQTPKVSHIIEQKLSEQSGIQLQHLDLLDLNLPIFTDEDPLGNAVTLLDAYKEADGIIIVTPEYNHSLPSVLKNAIDYARARELSGVPVAGVGVSEGSWGGVRVLKELAYVWQGVGGISLPVSLPTPDVEAFDSENPPADWSKRADYFLEKTIYWFRVIRDGKEANT